MAIILSMKLSPASLVTRITIQSDKSVVPPVTALLSPPASRITGINLAKSITSPILMLRNGVFALKPANAEACFLAFHVSARLRDA